MNEGISRRRFLRELVVFGGASLILSTLADAKTPPAWQAVGPADKFTQDHYDRVILADETVVYITRTKSETFLALSGSCTHKGCPVEWDAKQRQFACPCHRGRFDKTGRNMSGPPPRPLPVWQTQVDKKGILSVLPPS